MKNKAYTFRSLFLIVPLIVFSHISVSYGDNTPVAGMAADHLNELTSIPSYRDPTTHRKTHMLVAFSKFKGEAPGDSLAPEWAEQMFNGEKGSIPYYFDEISFGQMKVTGEYLPKRYELPRDETFYVNNTEQYSYDLLKLIDKDKSVNFADYDNDGPDGIPASVDDDGLVDYIVLMPMSRPVNFIRQYATGIASLKIIGTFYTNDLNYINSTIRIKSYSGSIAVGSSVNQAIGTICHEYIHYFGLPDLYDTSYTDNESDSGGIGFWCVMGQGSIGWNYQGGPVAPCAYVKMRLGIIGINNSNIEDIFGIHKNVRISDVALAHGKVYRIWINSREYFLIEYRRNDSTHADRNIPKNGLLIWHIYENSYGNHYEESKLCDLECADGKFLDAGYPKGTKQSASEGGDNLDFWAHDDWYTETYAGNLGDASDVFDGRRYTRFGTNTNPNTNSMITDKQTGIEISNIRPSGKDMVFDVSTPPFTDWDKEKYPLIGTAYLRHNIVFEIEGTLLQKGNAVYRIQYGTNSNEGEILTVFEDSLTVDTTDSLNYLDIQNIIEQRIVSGDLRNSNSRITRSNMSLNELTDELAVKGISFEEIGSGRTPSWIQKISVTFEEPDRQKAIALSQNYPNPFNSLTAISYQTAEAGPVTLEVFNLIGQKVLSVDRGYEDAGFHSVTLNFEGLSSGVYVYRIIGRSISESKKLLLIR
ncbi:T9SS type A sorting domain-containing protein [Candidatus Latescibacterota bacterium]